MYPRWFDQDCECIRRSPASRDGLLSRAHVLRAASIAATLATLAGCSNPFDGGHCVDIGVFGISAYVVDATTNGAPTSVPAVRLTDGAYVESLTAPFSGSNPYQYSGALERPGRYDVTVEAPGYITATRAAVEVTRGGRCNAVRPVRLDIALTRS